MTVASMNITLRAAIGADMPQVARMNLELIEDEGHRNPMNLPQLEARARGFLRDGSGWHIDLVERDGHVIGFATWREEEDLTEASGRRIYLRQFYIARQARGEGTGRRAFERLISDRFPADTRILLEVLHSNPGGQAFWERMGFAPRDLGDIGRRFHAQHRHAEGAEILQQIAVVAGDLDDPAGLRQAEPVAHHRCIGLRVRQPRG